METRQLLLIDTEDDNKNEWRLDEATRQRGLAGVQLARQALSQALTRSFGANTPHAA